MWSHFIEIDSDDPNNIRSENYSIQFEISNNGPLFCLIRNERKHYLHSTKFL